MLVLKLLKLATKTLERDISSTLALRNVTIVFAMYDCLVTASGPVGNGKHDACATLSHCPRQL